MTFDTSDLSVFFSDFAVTATATTWATTPSVIFDQEYIEFEDIAREAPFILVKDADVPSTATTGDLFTVDDVNYQLVDKHHFEPGITRVVLALV